MKSMQELHGTPVERKGSSIVIPEGYTIATPTKGKFEALVANKHAENGTWGHSFYWNWDVASFLYIVPDHNYNPTKKEDDVVLEAFDDTIKALEEELQDVRTAKEAYLRLCKDAEAFAAIADKYGWFEKEEDGIEVPKPVEPEFKVGDKVRIKRGSDKIAPHDSTDYFCLGMEVYFESEGTLAKEDYGPGWWSIGGIPYHWSKNWLEKVEG